MTMADPQSGPGRSGRRSGWLRFTGVVVLVAGLMGAGTIYWTRSPDYSNDLSMTGFNRAQRRQMGQLYGKMGTVIEDWSQNLKRPGVQAVVVVAASVILAYGCFFFARASQSEDRRG